MLEYGLDNLLLAVRWPSCVRIHEWSGL